jgi:nitrite reductase/ring-hydroxylating ferredoxin subunit
MCEGKYKPGCRIFHVPREDSSQAAEIAIDEWKDAGAGDAKDQVMVFKYRGKFFAVNHVRGKLSVLSDLQLSRGGFVVRGRRLTEQECPHSSYPLSNGAPFDIEDFGITLSSGITCPKHDWSFDIHTGVSDRGSYKLQVWEVQTRSRDGENRTVEEVWVRRKQRIG